ncbi:hypothetical protein C8F01DRAFT_1057878 [Mycena amicta]|nr:hypothetical protein C8F01DRAFT_1057878 [Mycena amicta]
MSVIVFYDIPSTHPGIVWSPNTLKTRYALNFKGLSYTTKWIEYPDIEGVVKDLGGRPTRSKADGRPHYTLPMIHDPSTGETITDSFKIAVYLDKTYPDTPLLMPSGAFPLLRAFEEAMQPLLDELYPFAIPASHALLNPASTAYFRATREQTFSMTLEELFPTPGSEREATMWANVKDSFRKVDGWIRAGEAEYLGGKEPNYADLYVAAYINWLKIILPEEKWVDIKSWHEGRWARLVERLEKYETVV